MVFIRPELGQEEHVPVEITVASVLRRLSETYEAAKLEGRLGTCVQAAVWMGKHLRMFTDRVEHVSTLEDVPDDELERLRMRLEAEGMIRPDGARKEPEPTE